MFEKSWQDNADLRTKLAAAEKREGSLFQSCNDAMKQLHRIKQECDEAREGWQDYILKAENLQDDVKKLENEVEELEQDRDNLQAANGVLRDALKAWGSIYGEAYCEIGYCKCGNVMPSISHKMCKGCAIKLTRKALSFATEQAGERVQKVIELLQDAINETKNGEKLSDGFVAAAEDALWKFRGGAS